MSIDATLAIAAAGMNAQGTRMRVIAENIANSDTIANSPDALPYARKTVSFQNTLDRELGVHKVQIKDIRQDTNVDFKLKYMPDHPGADENGYVRTPNVNSLIESMDMREASRSYEANLGMIEQVRTMASRTIDLLNA